MVYSLPPRTHFQEGYVLLPRLFFDRLLYLNLSKRELKILLLVARLTYGCRNTPWARLRPTDFAAIGISPNNANVALKPLLVKGLLVQNGTETEYRINTSDLVDRTSEEKIRQEQLWNLVREQLRRLSQIENLSSQNENNILEMSAQMFSKQEPFSSQNENVSAGARWRFCADRGRFVRVDEAAIDKR